MNDIPTVAELEAMSPAQVKTLEDRLRRVARRRGLRLDKSRRRDPLALDYGTYQLVDIETGGVYWAGLPWGYGLNLISVAGELYGWPEGDLSAYGVDEEAGRCPEGARR